MEDVLKTLKVVHLSTLWSDLTQITSNGRQPQNIESGISQEPLVGYYPNLKLKFSGP